MTATYLSGYRVMWIVVLFDLPVDTKSASRAATKFREFLLDHGFEMSQFSVYARFCNGKEQYESHLKRIQSALPPRGEVQILQFTDKQYENSVRFSNKSRSSGPETPGQLALF